MVAILDGGLGHWMMAALTRLNFNIGPYGKNV
jgi:hypothetical protein